MPSSRRRFLQAIGVAGLATVVRAQPSPSRGPRVLVRSSWQTVNIGDIAHSPGLLRLLEEFFPEAQVTLWPSDVGRGVEPMLRRRFPHLAIVRSAADVRAAFEHCDFLLHGSGPSLVAETDLARWRKDTGKPFGVYGITLPEPASGSIAAATFDATLELLSAARFVFFRDSPSLRLAQRRGCTCPRMEFGPDAAFGCDLAAEATADQFLQRAGLEPGRFLCVIPRYRQTPGWLLHPGRPVDAGRQMRNEALKDRDHAPHREAIIRVVRETGLRVLICAEDLTQVDLGREILLDPLPPDVRPHVVHRDTFWLPDEALSVYRRSAGLFGNEMHSPILCVGQGVPALVCRWKEQTTKGLMWRDIGLDGWLFDFDEEAGRRQLPAAVRELAAAPDEARRRVAAARDFVCKRQQETMKIVRAQFA